MRYLLIVGLYLVLLPGLLLSQNNFSIGTGMDVQIPVPSVQLADLPGQDSATAVDPALIFAAMELLDRAGKQTTAGLVFGGLGNFSVFYNAGTAAGNEYSGQVPIVIVGLVSGVTRFAISFPTARNIKKAEVLLVDAFGAQNDDNLHKDILTHIRIAKNAASVVPIFAICGISLVTASMVNAATSGSGMALWVLGSAFAIAGLSATIVSSINISKVRKNLTHEANSLRVGLNGSGIGFNYCF